MSWNYRMATKVYSYKKKFKGKNEKLADNPDTRLFSIVEVYYDNKGIPNGYTEPNPLSNWEELSDLMGTYKLIGEALDKPIIDLDNFPNEWIEPKDGVVSPEEKLDLAKPYFKKDFVINFILGNKFYFGYIKCPRGGTGRRAGLKIQY